MEEIVFPAAFFQREESFEEASFFLRPSGKAAEAFAVKVPLVDFAIRSTCA